jgi:tripeptide aminopeptidase
MILKELGLADAHLDEHGYVYATIPAATAKRVPVTASARI